MWTSPSWTLVFTSVFWYTYNSEGDDMNKNIIYMLLCGLGGGLIGFFASHLNEAFGIIMFTIGVFLLVFSCIKLSK